MSSEASKTEAAPESAPSGGGGNKLVLILTLVNLLVVAGMVAILFMSFKKESAHPKVEDIAAGEAHGGAQGAKAEGGKEGGAHGEKSAEGGHGGGDKKKGSADYGKMIPLDQFTVNLTTPGSATPKFVRVNIVVQVKSDDAEAEFKAKEPQVRNTVIDVLNSKRPSDLATSDQRDFLKDELKDAFNKFMTNKVEGVFFTNFALSG